MFNLINSSIVFNSIKDNVFVYRNLYENSIGKRQRNEQKVIVKHSYKYKKNPKIKKNKKIFDTNAFENNVSKLIPSLTLYCPA